MADAGVRDEPLESLARVGKALGNGTRLELLRLLSQGERSVEALARAAGLGRTTCSAHLRTLREAGLVTIRRERTKIHYRLAGADVTALCALLGDVAGAHSGEAAEARARPLRRPSRSRTDAAATAGPMHRGAAAP